MQSAALPIVKKKPAAATPIATPTFGSMDADDTRRLTAVMPRRSSWTSISSSRCPDGLDAAAAPLLCAGITTYTPLHEAGIGTGARVAVMGLGGLGHMAVKLAVSFGAEVTVLSRSADKEGDARRLGATDFVLTNTAGALDALASRYDATVDRSRRGMTSPPS
jgi:uncharacterized zinc-type alcohol dehydrogenase-like protein